MEVAPPDEAPVGADNAFGYASEWAIFTRPPRDLGREKSSIVEFAPIAPLRHDAPMEFNIMSNNNRYIDLKEMKLYLRVKVTKADGSEISKGDRVSLVNYPIASLFQQVDLFLQQGLVSGSGNCYPYKAMMDVMLENDVNDIEGVLKEGLFEKDTPGGMDTTYLTAAEATADDGKLANAGFIDRAAYCTESKTFELMGKLHIDLCRQERLLLNAIQVTLKLTQSREPFRIMRPAKATGETATDYRVEIVTALLKVPMIKATEAMVIGHEEGLLEGPAVYPFERTEIKTFTIPSGERQTQIDNVFLSRLPKRLVIGLVPSAAFTGSWERNPFNFDHFNLNYLCLVIDGVCFPSKPLTLDYSNDTFLEAYDMLFSAVPDDVRGMPTKPSFIRREDFKNGYCIYCFSLDGSNVDSDYVAQQNVGLSRLDIKFASALEESVTIVMYATFNALLRVDHARNVRVDG